MLDAIRLRFAEPLSLSDIAEAGGISPRECLRCFKRTLATTPVRYLLQYRIAQSAALLRRDPALPVAEAAGRCGFDSPSYFSSQFLRFYHCPPTLYRSRADAEETAGSGSEALCAARTGTVPAHFR